MCGQPGPDPDPFFFLDPDPDCSKKTATCNGLVLKWWKLVIFSSKIIIMMKHTIIFTSPFISCILFFWCSWCNHNYINIVSTVKCGSFFVFVFLLLEIRLSFHSIVAILGWKQTAMQVKLLLQFYLLNFELQNLTKNFYKQSRLFQIGHLRHLAGFNLTSIDFLI